MEITKKHNTQILELLQSHFGVNQRSQRLYEPLTGFPISTTDEFFELEKNDVELKKIVSFL